MAVQDDSREQQMRDRFNLRVTEDRKRDGIDAFLRIEDQIVNFELKSTTSGSVSTVRDFGPKHIEKWEDLHWIIAVYEKTGKEILKCHYASPIDMAPWIDGKRHYVMPDVVLGQDIASKLTSDTAIKIFGGRTAPYTKEDAKWIMKNQWSAAQYKEAMDETDGYSLDRMTEMLQLRCSYLMARGSTLNNPHIERTFVDQLPLLDEEEPAISLRQYVRNYLLSASATEDATA
ncbi:hypothetical protein [Streptomyces sp. PsTaAH-124]|uniref:hypothetical protein n=1 Tax=Streptomyces sp. PsTaAH-124 TaxID=1157638 RepID=UPI000475B1A4|nr:hypothetical protein [Streptomyces sp. PsTaAH-124]